MLVFIWCTFSCVLDREVCLAEVLFLSRKDLHLCKVTLDKLKLPAHITRHDFVSGYKLVISFIFPCFCLIKETNERYSLRFTQYNVSSNVNDKMFLDFL